MGLHYTMQDAMHEMKCSFRREVTCMCGERYKFKLHKARGSAFKKGLGE